MGFLIIWLKIACYKLIIIGNLFCSNSFLLQLDVMKVELDKFYGKDPLCSVDLSRIVNSNHFYRLTKLLDDDKVSGKIVHGGQRDEKKL